MEPGCSKFPSTDEQLLKPNHNEMSGGGGGGGGGIIRSTIDSTKQNQTPPPPQGEEQALICYEGEALAHLLNSIQRQIQSARLLDTALPEKIWLKQQFAIGVNEVTRVIERMPPTAAMGSPSDVLPVTPHHTKHKAAPPVWLQAVLIASDCNPRWLTRHLPAMANSRMVPLIYVKDKRAGSLRLGELVKVKTAIAIGIKVKGNIINQLIMEILHDKGTIC